MTNLDTLVRNLSILLKADFILIELHVRRLAAKSAVFAFAGLCLAFGATMLGVAGFLVLQETYGTVMAATICGAVGMVLGLVLAAVAASIKAGREADLAYEVHKAAFQAVRSDLRSTGPGAQALGLSALAGGPIQSMLPGLIIPLLRFLFNMFRRRRPTV